MVDTGRAVFLVFVMGLAILFCRAFPFLFFGRPGHSGASRREAFLSFVEKTVPPAAMTVLAFNALAAPFAEDPAEGIPVLAAAVFTVLVHLLRRNPLFSIFGGTAVYMILTHLGM